MNHKRKSIKLFLMLIVFVFLNVNNILGLMDEQQSSRLSSQSFEKPICTFSEIKGHNISEKISKIQKVNPPFGEELYELEHDDEITTVKFSPNGAKLASGGRDGVIKLWEVSEGLESELISEHSASVTSLDFSPNGSLLASGSMDNTIRLWNVKDGSFYKTVINDTWLISSIDFSSDGKLFAASFLSFRFFKVWNTTNWEELITIDNAHPYSINSVQFSTDSTLLITASGEHTIKIWNTTTWETEYTFTEPTTDILEAVLTPNNRVIAYVTIDNTYGLWDWINEKPITGPEGHSMITSATPWSFSIDISPNGLLGASGGGEHLINLWDTVSGELLQTLPGHDDFVNKIDFSPDGTLLASCSSDSSIKIWNIAYGSVQKTFLHGQSTVTSIAYSPTSNILASGSIDQHIKFWNLSSGTEIPTVLEHEDAVTSVDFSPTGALLLSSSFDNTIKLWNVSSRTLNRNLTGHTDFVNFATFSETGELLASGGADTLVKLWNTSSGETLETLYGHTGEIYSVAFSFDDKLLASASEDTNVIIYDVITRNEKFRLSDHEEIVTSIAFSPINNLLASGSGDKLVKLWNASSGEWLKDLIGHTEAIWSLEFSPDGKILVTGAADNTIKLWNVSTGMEIQTYYLNRVKISSVAFSPDGNSFASVGASSSIKIFQTAVLSDFDEDGMSDSWELQYSDLDPSDFWDKFDDSDNDGLHNSLEYYLETYPNSTDSDYDNMPDGWEYLGGLNPTDPTDSDSDLDLDGLPALYEYQMGLNPRMNDALADKDADGLTNLQEYLFGSWANQSDTDLDDMPDNWEFKYNFNLTNPNDATLDSDGDWISNVAEFKAGSNPRDFWSVPPLALSFVLLIEIVFVLILGVISFAFFLNYRNKQKRAIIAELGAPDYPTALKIHRGSYSDYKSLLKSEDDAKLLVGKGINSYYQNNDRKAVRLYEQALTTFKRTENNQLVARTIFRIALIQKERQELTADSSILKLLPQSSSQELELISIGYMIQALLAETKNNWGLASEAWQSALSHEGLQDEFSLSQVQKT